MHTVCASERVLSCSDRPKHHFYRTVCSSCQQCALRRLGCHADSCTIVDGCCQSSFSKSWAFCGSSNMARISGSFVSSSGVLPSGFCKSKDRTCLSSCEVLSGSVAVGHVFAGWQPPSSERNLTASHRWLPARLVFLPNPPRHSSTPASKSPAASGRHHRGVTRQWRCASRHMGHVVRGNLVAGARRLRLRDLMFADGTVWEEWGTSRLELGQASTAGLPTFAVGSAPARSSSAALGVSPSCAAHCSRMSAGWMPAAVHRGLGV